MVAAAFSAPFIITFNPLLEIHPRHVVHNARCVAVRLSILFLRFRVMRAKMRGASMITFNPLLEIQT